MSKVISALQRCFPQKKIDIFGKDSLMHSSLPYHSLSLLAVLNLMGAIRDPLTTFIAIYIAIPLLDQIFSLDERNPSNKQRHALQQNDFYFTLALYIEMVLDWVLFFKTLQLFRDLQLNVSSLFFLVPVLFMRINFSAVQFIIAHEILHKPGTFYRYLGTFHMTKLAYCHYTYHHIYNHHIQVGTPSDPSTAFKDESVYSFFIRTVKGSWLRVYEKNVKAGNSWYKNVAILSVLQVIGLFSAISYFYGAQSTILYSIVVIGAIFYLQATNYLQHYGLKRDPIGDNKYQAVTARHSWNAPHRFSNYLTFKLQRHSDHHHNSTKPYQTLDNADEAPCLPHGYSLMILISFVPSEFRRIMNPLVQYYERNKVDKIDPKIQAEAIKETRKFFIKICLLGLVGIMIKFIA